MSAKQLYRVDVSFEMFVMAKSEDDALDVAIDYAEDELRNGQAEIDISKPSGRLPQTYLESCPYGADAGDDRAVREILADEAKASAA